MKPKTSGLGRGLSALIPGAETEEVAGEFVNLPVMNIAPNPLQPRRDFDDDSIRDLADSIKQQGVLQPILVEEMMPGSYRLLAGERRLRASRIAGLTEIPARVLTGLDDGQRGIITLLENLQREDLNAMEFAGGCQQILEETGWTHEDLAKRLSRARPTITNTIRLLTLPRDVQESIRRGDISEGHGRALLGAQEKDIPILWRTVLEQNMNVRQTELMVQNYAGIARSPKPKTTLKNGLDDPVLRGKLEEHLGCMVSFTGSEQRGKIVLSYMNEEQRQILLDKLLSNSHSLRSL